MRYAIGPMAVTLLLVSSGARADASTQDSSASSRPRFDAAASAEQGLMLPGLVAPGSLHASQAVATGWTGYDSARDSLVVHSVVDATLIGPLALRAGITYVPDSAIRSVQPYVGARLQLLNQDEHGFDLGVAAFYRMDRFTQEEGLAQALISGAVHFGRTGLFGHVGFGEDLEGDDREGEVSIALMHRLTRAFQLGIESRARFKLGSSDEKRRAQPGETFEGYIAPTASYALGPVALFAEVGPAAVRTQSVHGGVLAMAGVGGAL